MSDFIQIIAFQLARYSMFMVIYTAQSLKNQILLSFISWPLGL